MGLTDEVQEAIVNMFKHFTTQSSKMSFEFEFK